MTAAAHVRVSTRALLAAAVLAVISTLASAADRRDIVFECPCSAEWVAGEDGEPGTLTLQGGIRSFRATMSGDILLSANEVAASPEPSARLTPLPPRGRADGEWAMKLELPRPESIIEVNLDEIVGESRYLSDRRYRHESIALWLAPGDETVGAMRFVDILTDTDGDGVGDVNERLAGTSPEDPESVPGETVIDVLALFTDEIAEAEGGFPQTRMLHAINVASTMFEDSGANLRLRIVGMSEIAFGGGSDSAAEERTALMDSHGGDLAVQYGHPNCAVAGVGWSFLGARTTTLWSSSDFPAVVCGISPTTTAHELGHSMGLVHSELQGESNGAWRWSRGHYYTPRFNSNPRGTVMTYNKDFHFGSRFSNPDFDCGGVPCGVGADEYDGADSVRTLDILRFQIAAHRESAADTDGDGFVDAADEFPQDGDEWSDTDRDGIGDNADPDADNDGVNDGNDAFPLDPAEWSDTDGDRIGDNADPDDDNDGVNDGDDAFPLDPKDWSDTDGDGVGDHAQGLKPFRDLALRRAVETALAKEPGAPITAEDMAGLTSLSAAYADIGDLTGLELATKLRTLSLAGNRIRDLAPLSELKGLSVLQLQDNEVRDLEPLSGLPSLYRLDLSRNPVSDIGPLSGLTEPRELLLNGTDVPYADVLALPYFPELEGLGLAGLGIRDVSPFTELPLRNLNLSDNPIVNATALSALTDLQTLYLSGTELSEIGFLAGMSGLSSLRLRINWISDIGPLANLVNLSTLDLEHNRISDLSPLAGMTELRNLYLSDNAIADIDPLEPLVNLQHLSLKGNDISGLSPLVGMTELTSLYLNDNAISDLSALSDLTALKYLYLSDNAIADIDPLEPLVNLQQLSLKGNDISGLSPLAGMTELSNLYLSDNVISDLSALSGLTGLIDLRLERNAVTDIAPLMDLGNLIWLTLGGNPLSDQSVEEHIPALRSRGVNVSPRQIIHDVDDITIADPTLHSVVGQAVAAANAHIDDDPSEWDLARLQILRVYGLGITSLVGVEESSLQWLYAARNRISDLSPLAKLPELFILDLRDNRISDLGPLVSNVDFADGDLVNLGGNPLSEESVNEHIPALLERGVSLSVSPVLLTVVAGGEQVRFQVSGYFESLLDSGFTLEASIDDASAAAVEMTDGVLVVVPNASGRAGQANVTVTARRGGRTETLSFAVTLVGPQIVPLFPADSGVRQGFMRVINRGDQAAQARIVAIDDSGLRTLPLMLAVGAGEAVHFNATDLEAGDPDKGLSGSTGRGTGDWRLEMESAAELDVLPFVRAADGFITAMHELAAVSDSVHRVHTFNPASELENTSSLRLVNRGGEAAEAVITGVDDLGQSPGGEVRVDVPAGAAVTVTAAEFENGGPGLRGRLGDGTGKWRLEVRSQADLTVMNLLSSLDGHLANLSGEGVEPRGDGVHVVPLFLSAADPMGRQGVVRVINRSDSDGVVRIQAYDDEGYAYGPLELSLSAGHAAHFDSRDLELGNAEKGLSGSAGSGIGDWRLELSSDLDIQALAYVRTEGGFLTSVHDGVPQAGRRFEVATFYPAGHVDGTSRLRIVNPGSRPANVSIAGIDDAGESPGEAVRLSVPAGWSRTLTASQLQTGVGLPWHGALGSGTGLWRLVVDCEQPIVVMNLLEGVTGQLTNLTAK